MHCSCPKCNTEISLDIQELPEDGYYGKCPECGVAYILRRESFAYRALRRDEKITCALCGKNPGTSIYCKHCHGLYPNFHVTESGTAASKSLAKTIAKLKSFRKVGNRSTSTYHHLDLPSTATPKKATKGVKLPGQPVQLAATLLIILALLAGGGYFFYQDKLEREYCDKFVRAVYAVKSLTDLHITTCNKIASDWKALQTPQAPNPSPAEKGTINRAIKDLELAMNALPKTPEKYSANKTALDSFYAEYKKVETLTMTPSGTPDSFAEAVKNLATASSKSGSSLKNGLQGKLADTFATAQSKYKPLKDM